MNTDLVRAVCALVIVPFIVLPTQRLVLRAGRQLDVGQIVYVAIGGLIGARALQGLPLAWLAVIALGVACGRALALAYAGDAFTLVSFCLWLLTPTLNRQFLHNATVSLSGAAHITVVAAACCASVFAAWWLSRTPVGAVLRALKDSRSLLRASGVRIGRAAIQFELAALALGLAAGAALTQLVAAYDETTLALEPQWVMGVAAASAYASGLLSVTVAVAVMAVRAAVQVWGSEISGADVSGLLATVVAVLAVLPIALGARSR